MELKTHRAGTMVDLAWNEPNRAVPDIDHHVERLVHEYCSSIAESMFGLSPTIARRRSVCVRCHAGVQRSSMSALDRDRYGASAVCPMCAATLDRSRDLATRQ